MSILNYFKNTPGRPPIGRQDLSVIFFLQICNEVPGKKGGACRPCNGRQGPVTPPRATSGRARPRARQGPVAPPIGRPGYPPLYKVQPPFPPHFSPKIPAKIQ